MSLANNVVFYVIALIGGLTIRIVRTGGLRPPWVDENKVIHLGFFDIFLYSLAAMFFFFLEYGTDADIEAETMFASYALGLLGKGIIELIETTARARGLIVKIA